MIFVFFPPPLISVGCFQHFGTVQEKKGMKENAVGMSF